MCSDSVRWCSAPNGAEDFRRALNVSCTWPPTELWLGPFFCFCFFSFLRLRIGRFPGRNSRKNGHLGNAITRNATSKCVPVIINWRNYLKPSRMLMRRDAKEKLRGKRVCRLFRPKPKSCSIDSLFYWVFNWVSQVFVEPLFLAACARLDVDWNLTASTMIWLRGRQFGLMRLRWNKMRYACALTNVAKGSRYCDAVAFPLKHSETPLKPSKTQRNPV